jgi:peptidoglycan/xylan/chitin deacetylase (PgdA/CDA1 family)
MMDWVKIVALSENGVEIGSHTRNHDILPSIKDPDKLRDEIVASKEIIEGRIGKRIDVMAFPNGYTNHLINRICLDAGFKFLLEVADKIYLGKNKCEDVFPRILIHHTGYYENVVNSENIFGGLKSLIK